MMEPQRNLTEGVTPTASVLARAKIDRLEQEMRKLPQVELPTEILFCKEVGMVARVVHHAAGVVVVGRVHKKEHFFIVAKGRLQIDDRIYEPGTILLSKPGTKRAAVALEDAVLITVHRTDKKNLQKIEKELVEPDEKSLFDPFNRLKAKALK